MQCYHHPLSAFVLVYALNRPSALGNLELSDDLGIGLLEMSRGVFKGEGEKSDELRTWQSNTQP